MKISSEVYERMKRDVEIVVKSHGLENSVRGLWEALAIVSRNRAFDDSHPAFRSGTWRRVLPFDGRNYCWYYANGCNDAHVETALRKIMSEIEPCTKPLTS